MSCSRSCEIFALLSFLQFGESLGTASNKQEDLMMNSEKPRIRTRNEVFVKYNILEGIAGK